MKLINDNFDDYFEANAPKKVNAPHEETEEEREERELNETTIERRSKKKRIALLVGSALVLLILLFVVRGCYYNHQDSTVKGLVTDITLKGTVFKTYEGTLNKITVQSEGIIEKQEFKFSTTNDSIAKALSELKQTPVLVQLHYKQYKSSLPWRGESKFVVDSIKTDLPVEYVNTVSKYRSSATAR